MRVGVRRGVGDMVHLVADHVVGVSEEICADGRRDDFGAFVVGEGRGDAA